MALENYLIDESMYSLKSPYEMTPVGICIHNTAGDRTARAEIDDMGTNSKEVSFHIAIDDKEALIAIPLNRNAWHAGDGLYGEGNRRYISIEICYSYSKYDLFDIAEARAIKEVALLLKKYNWTVDNVRKHKDFSATECPKRTCELGWERFLNKVKEEYEKIGGAEVPKNLPKFKEVKINHDEVYNTLSDLTDLKGVTLYCEPTLFTFDEKEGDKPYDDLTGDYGNDRDMYNPNAYTPDSLSLIEDKKLYEKDGYHIFIDGDSVIEVIPIKKISNHLKDSDNNTYINKNLYNNKANDSSISIVMLMPKDKDYKDIENMTARYIATFILKNKLTIDYFMRAFDLNRCASPLHLLDKTKWRSFVKKVENYYNAILDGKYTDNDLKDLNNEEPTTKDGDVRKLYFEHYKDYNEYAKNYEPDDRDIDIITNPNNPNNQSGAADEISSFESKNKITFAYTVSEKNNKSVSCGCNSPYDSLVVKVTPNTLEVEPIYPDIIVPPGGSITLVENITESKSNVTSNISLSIEDFESRQKTFNAKDYKDAKKEIKGAPVNLNDPFPIDIKIEELQSHTPKIKIDEVNYKMLECNHTGSQLAADVSKDLGMIQDQLLTIAKRTERRLVKVENTLATITRNLFRIGSRMQINCVYYGGQDVYSKYKSIRCLCDDRINDGQSMTLDQCLSCTRYEPIIGQVYAILDESGTNITQILDDAQMSYTNLDDYIKLSRTEEMLDEKKMADIKEEIKETPKTFKDTMEEGFIMDWNNVPLETQKPNIAEYDAEGIEPNKPIIKSPNNQPKKENEFKDKREENKAYEELKFNSEDYIFGRFSKATDYTSSNSFNMSSSEARQKIVNYAKMVLERCQNGTAGYSQANRKQEINGILYHDCSSFVATAYMEAGITIGNTSFEQYPMCYSSAGGKLIKISDMDHALPGDIIFYDYSYSGPENPDDYPTGSLGNIGHVGIYIGDGKSIEALSDEYELKKQIDSREVQNSKGAYAFGRPKALVDADNAANNANSGGTLSSLDDSYWNIEYHNFSSDKIEAATKYLNADSMKENMETYGYKDIVIQKAKEHGHDPYVILAIISTESSGIPGSANSNYGGLMGTPMSYTSATSDRESIIQQIENGCTILTQKANAMANIGYPDDICLAIYSYNAGEGTVSQALQNLNAPQGVKVKGGEVADAIGSVAQNVYGWSYEEKSRYFAFVLVRYIEFKSRNLLG